VTDFNRHLLKITAAGEKSVILNNDSMVLAGIGMGSDRRLYISNNTSGQLIRVDTNGQNRTVFSSGLVTPLNIFFDKEGGMYVTGAAIYKIAADGTYIQAIPPPSQFTGWEATLGHNGIFYETDNERHFIRRINKDGSRTIIAGNGVAADIDGIGMDSSFDSPIGITSDKDGNLYVTNYNFTTRTGNRIRKVSFY
jgi:sugar lactone lactonase YvrE